MNGTARLALAATVAAWVMGLAGTAGAAPASKTADEPGAVAPPPVTVTTSPPTGRAASPPPAKVDRRYAKRTHVGVEFAPGVDIPFKRYLDFGSGVDTYSMENGVGFGFGFSLVLNSFELRWGYSRLSTGQVVGRVPDNLAAVLRDYFGQTPQQDVNVAAPGPLVLHSFTAGYRFTFEPKPSFRLMLPLAGGLVIADPPEFGPVHYELFGFAASTGLQAEYTFARVFSVGAGARVSFYVTEPDPNLAAAGIFATQSLFNNTVAWLPMLSVTAHLRVHY